MKMTIPPRRGRTKTQKMLFKKNWRIATLNVGGSAETAAYVDKMMKNHGIDIVAITETHLKPEGKIQTGAFGYNVMRPPPEQGNNSGGVSLFLRKVAGSRVIFKRSEKNFQLIIAQVCHIKNWRRIYFPRCDQRRNRGMPADDKHACKRKSNCVR